MKADGILLDIIMKAQRALEGLAPGRPPYVRLVYDPAHSPLLAVHYRDQHGGWMTGFVADSIPGLLEALDMALMEKTWDAIGRQGSKKCIDCRKRPATDTALCDECLEHLRQLSKVTGEAGGDR